MPVATLPPNPHAGVARARGPRRPGARPVGAAHNLPGRTPGGRVRGRPARARTRPAARDKAPAAAARAQRVRPNGRPRQPGRLRRLGPVHPEQQHPPAGGPGDPRARHGVARRRRRGGGQPRAHPLPRPPARQRQRLRLRRARVRRGHGAGVGDALRECGGAAVEAAPGGGRGHRGQPPLVAMPGALGGEDFVGLVFTALSLLSSVTWV